MSKGMAKRTQGITRRDFLKSMGVAGAGFSAMVVGVPGAALDKKPPVKHSIIDIIKKHRKILPPPPGVPVPTLNPSSITKYLADLVIPPAMPVDATAPTYTQYRISARQFKQQVLPPPLPQTTVWGYGSASGTQSAQSATNHWPALTVETRTNKVVRVHWGNELVDSNGKYLQHLFYVDPTLHWANPPGPADSHGMFMPEATPSPYTGPVPITTHVHGAHVTSASDGGPETWFLPAAYNIPLLYKRQGTHYNSVQPVLPGHALYEYPNSQPASTLWYHDHVLGMTRLNVHAGLAGFWLIRDIVEDGLNLPGPAPQLGDAPGKKYYEIPLAIQDRSFNSDGSLFFPSSRAYFGDWPMNAPYVPTSDVAPYWNPEYFGNAMVVNGNTWPKLTVEKRLYRFRLLNGCNARTLILSIVTAATQSGRVQGTFIPDSAVAVPFHVIGSDGGLLHAPLTIKKLVQAPAERWDVIVDFSGFNAGDVLYLINEGPDVPYTAVDDDPDDMTNPATTGQVMKFVVAADSHQGNAGVIPATLRPTSDFILPAPAPAPRDLILVELDSNYLAADEGSPVPGTPIMAEMGTIGEGPLSWGAPITENPNLNDGEIWRIINFTGDGHPIHLHMVQFKVLDRTPLDADALYNAMVAYILGGKVGPPPDPTTFVAGSAIPAYSYEGGFKDTAIAYPGYMLRIQTNKFDIPGLFVWHCHIIDHEDNEMMRPLYVGPIPPGTMI